MILDIIIVALLAYQVSMPAVDNAKYAVTIYEGKILRMNTQNGSFEICDSNLQCKPVEKK